jgi:hypothetical protein
MVDLPSLFLPYAATLLHPQRRSGRHSRCLIGVAAGVGREDRRSRHQHAEQFVQETGQARGYRRPDAGHGEK